MQASDGAATLLYGRSDAPVRAFWCRIPSAPNFGDFLGPWLVKRITGRYPRFVRPEDQRSKYFVGGSIISYAIRDCTVWGSGLMDRGDFISPEATLLAVRGPLTRRRALECGASCPEVFGDPALLLPMFYRPAKRTPCRLGVVGHFSDMARLAAKWRHCPDAQLIDVQDPIESVIDRIASCEFVASSSLHGLIVSHAYGVPAAWIELRPLPSGDRSKFQDYFASMGHYDATPVELDYDQIDVAAIAQRVELPGIPLNADPLWQTCPFRT
jgi:pyruvyltransferase